MQGSFWEQEEREPRGFCIKNAMRRSEGRARWQPLSPADVVQRRKPQSEVTLGSSKDIIEIAFRKGTVLSINLAELQNKA